MDVDLSAYAGNRVRIGFYHVADRPSYTGTNDFDANDQPVLNASQNVCAKRLSSCKARFGANNELPFGSFPGIGSATAG